MVVAESDVLAVMKGGMLLDKGGFYDGDMFQDEYWDLAKKHLGYKPGASPRDEGEHEFSNGPHLVWPHVRYRQKNLLEDAVRRWLVPRLPVPVVLETVVTIHNGLRAVKVDGEDVTRDNVETWRELLDEFSVEVRWAELEALFIEGARRAGHDTNPEAAAP
jgi:hypothetical protein